MGAGPDPNAASYFSPANPVAKALGEDHDQSLYASQFTADA
jgi:hypothetical protein